MEGLERGLDKAKASMNCRPEPPVQHLIDVWKVWLSNLTFVMFAAPLNHLLVPRAGSRSEMGSSCLISSSSGNGKVQKFHVQKITTCLTCSLNLHKPPTPPPPPSLPGSPNTSTIATDRPKCRTALYIRMELQAILVSLKTTTDLPLTPMGWWFGSHLVRDSKECPDPKPILIMKILQMIELFIFPFGELRSPRASQFYPPTLVPHSLHTSPATSLVKFPTLESRWLFSPFY